MINEVNIFLSTGTLEQVFYKENIWPIPFSFLSHLIRSVKTAKTQKKRKQNE